MQGSSLSMRNTLGNKLIEIGRSLSDLVVITADVGDSTRASRFGEVFPDRYFNIGISEQDLVGFSAGMAAAGFRPLVVNFAMFLMRAWEQIRNTVCRMNLNVKFIVTHAGFSDAGDGSSHQVLEDIALMRVLPNMKVIVPADAKDIERSLEKVINSNGPVYYRIGRDYSPSITNDVDYEFEIGKGYVLREGEDITIAGAGVVLWDALKAAEELKDLGINCAVINVLSIKPIDEDLIEYYARKTGAIITIEEHSIYGGIGSAISEVTGKKYPVPMGFIGTNSFGRSAKSQRELLDKYGITSKAIIEKALELVKRRG